MDIIGKGSDVAGVGGPAQLEQARLWKEYIGWERSNPQRLDAPSLAQRVSLAYDQALMPLMHFPEARRSSSLINSCVLQA